MGFLADPVKSVSDTVSHVGQVISGSHLPKLSLQLVALCLAFPHQSLLVYWPLTQ